MLKSIIFLVKSFLGNIYRHLEKNSGHADVEAYQRDKCLLQGALHFK